MLNMACTAHSKSAALIVQKLDWLPAQRRTVRMNCLCQSPFSVSIGGRSVFRHWPLPAAGLIAMSASMDSGTVRMAAVIEVLEVASDLTFLAGHGTFVIVVVIKVWVVAGSDLAFLAGCRTNGFSTAVTLVCHIVRMDVAEKE
jgi:hypothetical protein